MKKTNKCMIYGIIAVSLVVWPSIAFSVEDVVTDDVIAENIENNLMEISGSILSVDHQEQQLVIEYQAAEQDIVTAAIFDFSDETQVYSNEKLVTISELKEGNTVTVAYVINDDDSKIIKIVIINN